MSLLLRCGPLKQRSRILNQLYFLLQRKFLLSCKTNKFALFQINYIFLSVCNAFIDKPFKVVCYNKAKPDKHKLFSIISMSVIFLCIYHSICIYIFQSCIILSPCFLFLEFNFNRCITLMLLNRIPILLVLNNCRSI